MNTRTASAPPRFIGQRAVVGTRSLWTALCSRLGSVSCVAASAIGLLSSGAMAQAESPRAANVTGRVVNALTGVYVANARVTLEGTNISAVTDEGGIFVLREVPTGSARIRASYVGFQPQSRAVDVGQGVTVVDDFTLTHAVPETASESV